MFDYNKTYYKVTNEKENHNGYQYKDGLNILKEKFNSNPENSCVKGGFYFTDYNNLLWFLDYGVYIRKVKIPKDARVVKDLGGDKWRTDKIIFGKKYKKEKYIDKIFNPKLFNWEKNSWLLARHFSKNFDKWFDPKLYNWENNSWALAQYCSKHFDKWFDPKLYNWENNSSVLAEYCSKYFDKWFDPELFNWEDSWALAENCSKHFKKWFDPDKFNWEDGTPMLEKYCKKYEGIWMSILLNKFFGITE